ncbi:MAG: HupE/UreJ family protein [Cyclobacteriaceae bacterium]
MSTFSLYFNLGLTHILDIQGYDHILFVVALCALYMLRDWRKVLILITAFTIGHSITLALATLDLIRVNASLIEFLIPVTIFITATSNIFKGQQSSPNRVQLNYGYALFFGLIHGMGFSNYLRSLLGREESITVPLLGFNLGLELGQIVIVLVVLIAASIFVNILNVARRDWKIVISSAVAGIALTLMMDTKFW